ncbi:MAG: TIR domain-containing protein [Terracidiphilus sp.]
MSETPRDRVFVSYSHKDAEWLDSLLNEFQPAVRNGLVDLWMDRGIEPSDPWRQMIYAGMDSARAAILLISPNFFASKFIMDEELPRLRASEAQGLRIFWIPVHGVFSGPGAMPELAHLLPTQAAGPLSPPLAGQDAATCRATLLDLARQVERLIGHRRQPGNLPFGTIGTLFKGRDEDIAALAGHLAENGAAAIVQPEAITGMGGIGKTRLALEYAWRRKGDFSALLFVSANTPEDLETNLARLSTRDVLDLPESRQPNQQEQYEAVVEWLRRNKGWLAILDNVDTPDAVAAVKALLPRLDGGQVLITSRIARWGKAVRALGLGLLGEQAAAAYLLDATKPTFSF